MRGWNPVHLNRRDWHFLNIHPRDLIVLVIIAFLLFVFAVRALQYNFIGNLQILAIAMATVGIVSVGQTLVVLTGGVDLSVGSLMALTGVVIAGLIDNRLIALNPWIAAGIGLLIATGIGWIHGILIARFKLAPFIVTFGSLSLLRGLAQVMSNGSAINLHTGAYDWLWDNLFGIIPVPAIMMTLLFIGAAFILQNTRLGRYVYAIGSNEKVARLSGVDVERTQLIIYATSGFLAGLAGLFLMVRIEGGTFNNGANYELLSIAAVIIGGTSLKGGTGGVWGTLVGVLVMSLVSNGLVLLSVPPLWKEAITGALIITAALIDVQRRRLQESTPAPVQKLAPPAIRPSMPLDESLRQLFQTVQTNYGFEDLRVYLWDREAEMLVEPHNRIEPQGDLAHKCYRTAKPVFFNPHPLQHNHNSAFVPWREEMRTAAAVPIRNRTSVIGVIELQSASSDTFSLPLLESLSTLSAQIAPNMEDRWLLESGWLTGQVRECLRNMSDDVYLNHCALADWLQINDLMQRSILLRQMLAEAIDSILNDSITSNSRAMQRHQILRQTYIEHLPAEMICMNLNFSRRKYFYDLKQAVDMVVDFIYSHRQQFSLHYETSVMPH